MLVNRYNFRDYEELSAHKVMIFLAKKRVTRKRELRKKLYYNPKSSKAKLWKQELAQLMSVNVYDLYYNY
jgi:hypothetical protein